MSERLTQRDLQEMSLKTSADVEASKAAEFIGAPLACYGLLLRDHAGQLSWYNRAHRRFAAAVASTGDAKTIAFLGVTREGEMYFHTSFGHDDSITEVRSFERAFRGAALPTKDVVCIARLLRSEMRKRIAAATVQDEKLISAVCQIPECADTFYCRTIEDPPAPWDDFWYQPIGTRPGTFTYTITWDEPSEPSLRNTNKEN